MLGLIRLALPIVSGNGIIFAGIAAVIAFVAYVEVAKHSAASKAVAAAVERTEKEARKADAKSEAARADAARPGAADRLRADKLTCRDCEQVHDRKPVPKLAASDRKQK